MSAAVGGSIESCTIDGRRFAVAADADANRDLGGYTNAVESNGDGSARIIKTRKPWKIDGLTLEVSALRGDPEFLQEKADAKDFYPITVTHADGSVYGGQGIITGDLAASTMKATCPVTFSGQKKLEVQ